MSTARDVDVFDARTYAYTWDDIVRGTSSHKGGRDYARFRGCEVASDDGLQAREGGSDAREGVGCRVRHGSVAAMPNHSSVVESGRGHDGPRHGADGARSHAGPHVEREDSLNLGLLLQHACLQHRQPSGAALLSRLEYELHSASERRFAFFENLGGGEQHRSVCIVAARVHLPVRLRAKRPLDLLEDWQGVHVCAKANHRRFASANLCHNTIGGDRHVRNFEIIKHSLDVGRRFLQRVKKLWASVKMAPMANSPF